MPWYVVYNSVTGELHSIREDDSLRIAFPFQKLEVSEKPDPSRWEPYGRYFIPEPRATALEPVSEPALVEETPEPAPLTSVAHPYHKLKEGRRHR